MDAEKFRKKFDDTIGLCSKKLEGIDCIDAKLGRLLYKIDTGLQGITDALDEHTGHLQSMRAEVKAGINQSYVSRITHMDFHDGEMTYR